MRNDRRGLESGTAFFARAILFVAGLLLAASGYSAPKTLLVLGDSLSAEYGLARGSGWVALLDRRLKSEQVDVAIVNASISGETTSGGRARLQALLDQHRPSLVIVELGANDGLRGLPVPAAQANLMSIVRQSQEAGAKVLLLGMQIPPNYGRDYAQRFYGMYAAIARDTRVPLVPFLLEGVANNDSLFQADRLHPTAEAQAILLRNVWPHLEPLLRKQDAGGARRR